MVALLAAEFLVQLVLKYPAPPSALLPLTCNHFSEFILVSANCKSPVDSELYNNATRLKASSSQLCEICLNVGLHNLNLPTLAETQKILPDNQRNNREIDSRKTIETFYGQDQYTLWKSP
ncbi:hypothetical protein J6590_001603 [Homalodisca vitripennis]|nr:hypothetical protein J6590_001603 [Homalodisca vitripennis]